MTQPYRIWIVKQGEPLPINQANPRRMRAGMLAQVLSKRGHDVTWWTSTFDHYTKDFYFTEDRTVAVPDGPTIELLHTPGYRGHISLERFRDHALLVKKFLARAEREPHPHLILCPLPIPQLAQAAVRYGKAHGVPVIVDIRDWWPDIFYYQLPKPLNSLAKLLFWPFAQATREACRGAYAITGVTEDFVAWGLRNAGRAATESDRTFYLGFTRANRAPEELAEARAAWSARGVPLDSSKFILPFFGQFNRTLDLDTIIHAARLLEAREVPALFVLCGKGDQLERLQAMSRDLSNVIWPGWVSVDEMQALTQVASAGLDPLPNRPDFLCHINNKAAEYLSAGLPVISSPNHGTLYRLLQEHACGMSYPSGDPEALAGIVETLYRNSARRQTMAEAASRLFERQFVADTIYRDMSIHLEMLVERWAKERRSAQDGQRHPVPVIR